ncbi:MAG: AbrB/MazE/SpoVT family DNA-binding domain-containing protein [Methanimicrococcus sp.]|nr:AbrB/MazE/SpoVT family DNA-binding domain-containing protein [Methanimicrococcus sp.]
METRKVQQTGGSTYIISLPKQWAEKVGIAPGVRVGVQPQPNGKLLISPAADSKPLRRKSIDITNLSGDALERAFIATYLAGYDIIELTSPKIMADQKKILRTVCHKLIGPEIIEESSTFVLVQDLLSPNELSIKKAVQRMGLIANSMFNDCILAVANCDEDLASDVMERDDEVDRLYMVISKQFKAIVCGTGFVDMTESSIEEYHDLRMTASPIERIADHAHRIAHMVQLFHPQIDEKRMAEIRKLSDLASDTFKKSIESLYTFNPKLANQVIENQDVMDTMINNFNRDYFDKMTDMPFGTLIAIRTIIDSIGRIADYAANIGEIAIDASIDSPNAKW